MQTGSVIRQNVNPAGLKRFALEKLSDGVSQGSHSGSARRDYTGGVPRELLRVADDARNMRA